MFLGVIEYSRGLVATLVVPPPRRTIGLWPHFCSPVKT